VEGVTFNVRYSIIKAHRGRVTQLADLARRIVEKRLTYFGPGRLSLLMETIEKLNAQGVRGNLAEFGIALGGSAICIASKLRDGQKFYGFDNFDLIPEPEPVDGEVPNTRYEEIKSGRSAGIGGDLYYGYQKDRFAIVSHNFEEFGLPVDDKRIFLIKGLFEETLPGALKEPVAFAHVDCDWYSPVKLCLEALYPRLSSGGRVFVDDYNHWDGCTKATDEFCAAHADVAMITANNHAILVKG
jgi:O-methyltransferase